MELELDFRRKLSALAGAATTRKTRDRKKLPNGMLAGWPDGTIAARPNSGSRHKPNGDAGRRVAGAAPQPQRGQR